MFDRAKLWVVPASSCLIFAATTAMLDRDLLVASEGNTPPLTARESAAIHATLTFFNKVYQDFYATGGDPALIDQFPATKSVKHYVFRDLGYLGDAGLVLVLDLASMRVLEGVRIDAGAEVLVREEWNFMYQHARDRTPAAPPKGMSQTFRYRLSDAKGEWMVTDWAPEKTADKTGETLP